MKSTNVPALNRICVSVCSEFTEAEIRLRELPQDPLNNYAVQIASKIKAGIAQSYNITKDGRYAGFFITEKYGSEFVILAMQTLENVEVFSSIMETVESMAKNFGCSSITFNTVRAGLISKSLNNGFSISTVTMRKIL